MNLPVTYNFEPHYKDDGLAGFILKLTYPSGEVVDLTGCSALMQLRIPEYRKDGKVIWEFSSEAEDPLKLLVLNSSGEIQFPRIESWDIPKDNYQYDLQVTDSLGFVRTFMKGIFPVNQDVSR